MKATVSIPRGVEKIAEKPARTFGNDHHVRLGEPLQACCKVWCLANDAAFVRCARPGHQITHNHKPSGDARWHEDPPRALLFSPSAPDRKRDGQ
jgi:hypothetical protein